MKAVIFTEILFKVVMFTTTIGKVQKSQRTKKRTYLATK